MIVAVSVVESRDRLVIPLTFIALFLREVTKVTGNPKPTTHRQQQKQNSLLSRKKFYVEDVFCFSRKSECFC